MNDGLSLCKDCLAGAEEMKVCYRCSPPDVATGQVLERILAGWAFRCIALQAWLVCQEAARGAAACIISLLHTSPPSPASFSNREVVGSSGELMEHSLLPETNASVGLLKGPSLHLC